MKQITDKKLHYKWILMGIIGVSSTLIGCSSFFKRNPAATNDKPKHYILTLHGVRGNEQSYGSFHKIVKEHLEKVDPTYEVVPLNFTYTVARTDYTIHSAAAEINQKLDLCFNRPSTMISLSEEAKNQVKRQCNSDESFGKNDKISVVAYSMGGQVGMAWYYDSLKDEHHKMYPMQTDKFISLGGAFWGAQEAALFTSDVETLKKTIKTVIITLNDKIEDAAIDAVSSRLSADRLQAVRGGIQKIRTLVRENLLETTLDQLKTLEQLKEFYDENIRPTIANISFAELEALSIASPAVTELRLNHIQSNSTPTKWISISTLVPCFRQENKTTDDDTDLDCKAFQKKSFSDVNEFFTKYLFGLNRRETDNAVITPSSVSQFMYYIDGKKTFEDGHKTLAAEFKPAVSQDKQKTYFAETLHATVITEKYYANAMKVLGRFGRAWQKLADDVVIIHDNCLNPNECDHPVYKYIVDELSSCQETQQCNEQKYNEVIGTLKTYGYNNPNDVTIEQTNLKNQLHGFTVELNLRFPQGYDLSHFNQDNVLRDLIKIKKYSNVLVDRKEEMASVQLRKVHYSDEEHLKINITGYITDEDLKAREAGKIISFDITHPSIKSRHIEAVVKPTLSTFIDLNMSRK